jgi:hypothetical protein
MALEIMKIVASATTTTSVGPTVTRFFRKVPSDVTGAATLTIDAADFLLDNGNAATTLPALSAGNSYFNVYMNGVQQMGGLSTYTPGGTGVGKLDVTVPAGQTVAQNTPVVLEIVSYAPSSTTTVTG